MSLSNRLPSDSSILSCKDLLNLGITYSQINQLRHKKVLLRSGRGVYTVMSGDITEHHNLALVSKQLPNTVICLLSALSFYGITTHVPSKMWVTIDYKVRHPKKNQDMVPVQFIYAIPEYLNLGADVHTIEGVNVKVYNIPKTVADCFKFRHKIGLDIALEALKEVYQDKHCTIDEIWHYAKLCRVSKIMKPYMEMLVHK